MKHIKLYETKAQLLAGYNGNDYIEPWVGTYTTPDSGETVPTITFTKPLTDFIYIELYQGSGGMFWQDTLTGQGKWGPDFSYSNNSVIFVHDSGNDTEGVYHKCVYEYTSTTGKRCYCSTDNNWVVSAASDEPLGESNNWLVGYNLNYSADIIRPS